MPNFYVVQFCIIRKISQIDIVLINFKGADICPFRILNIITKYKIYDKIHIRVTTGRVLWKI